MEHSNAPHRKMVYHNWDHVAKGYTCEKCRKWGIRQDRYVAIVGSFLLSLLVAYPIYIILVKFIFDLITGRPF